MDTEQHALSKPVHKPTLHAISHDQPQVITGLVGYADWLEACLADTVGSPLSFQAR